MIGNKKILITGGTGSLGRAICERIKKLNVTHDVTIYSRDELKQFEMRREFTEGFKYVIGDVRDYDRISYATKGKDIVIHAAALKHVPVGQENPSQFIDTNILGSRNVAKACEANGAKALLISTDKACEPVNLYGSTKMCAEYSFMEYGFNVLRYGNVIGSRGSIIPIWKKQKESGVLNLTDPDMTRFFISLDDAVSLVFKTLLYKDNSYIVVPKLKSVRMFDLARAIAPNAIIRNIGIRQGEKLHEKMISKDEIRNVADCGDVLIIGGVGKSFKGDYCSKDFINKQLIERLIS